MVTPYEPYIWFMWQTKAFLFLNYVHNQLNFFLRLYISFFMINLKLYIFGTDTVHFGFLLFIIIFKIVQNL